MTPEPLLRLRAGGRGGLDAASLWSSWLYSACRPVFVKGRRGLCPALLDDGSAAYALLCSVDKAGRAPSRSYGR